MAGRNHAARCPAEVELGPGPASLCCYREPGHAGLHLDDPSSTWWIRHPDTDVSSIPVRTVGAADDNILDKLASIISGYAEDLAISDYSAADGRTAEVLEQLASRIRDGA